MRRAAGPVIPARPQAIAAVRPPAEPASPSTGVPGFGSGSAGDPSVKGYVAPTSFSGTKTNAPILATPQSVYVVTRQEIEQQNIQTTRTLLRYLPGVNYSNDANNRLDTIQARGFTVDQYLDGLRLQGGTWSVPKVEPFLLERAELLLGPSSVLYGQASPGGLLNMSSKLPTATPFHEMFLQGGSFGYVRGGVDVSGPLDETGTLLGRFTGTAYHSDTQVSHQQEDRIAIAPSVTWRPDGDTSLTIQSSYLYDPHAGFWNQLPLQGTILPNRFGRIPRNFFVGDDQYEHFTREQSSIGYQFAHRFDSGWAFKQNVRYMHINTDYQEVQGSVLAADQRTLSRNAYSSRENLNTVALDNRLEGQVVTGPLQHLVVLGVDYQFSNWRNFTRFGNAPTLDILAPNSNQAALAAFLPPPILQNAVQTQNQVGLYAQDLISLGGFNLLLAGRQDWYSNQAANYLASTNLDQQAEHFSGHVGLNYVFDSGIAPYVSYSTSFQPTLGTTRAGTAFVPTTGEQIEGGIKYQPRDLNALFTLAVFDVRQNNVVTPDPVDVRFSVQTGQVQSQGVELSAVTSPIPGLNVRAAYTHLDTKITRNNTPGTVGNQLPMVPSDVVAGFAAYTIQGGVLAGFTFGGGVRYVGSAYTTAFNTLRMPAYTTVDALASYDLGRASPRLAGTTLAVNATNIFDERYVSTCGALGCYYGLGRSVIASLNYRW